MINANMQGYLPIQQSDVSARQDQNVCVPKHGLITDMLSEHALYAHWPSRQSIPWLRILAKFVCNHLHGQRQARHCKARAGFQIAEGMQAADLNVEDAYNATAPSVGVPHLHIRHAPVRRAFTCIARHVICTSSGRASTFATGRFLSEVSACSVNATVQWACTSLRSHADLNDCCSYHRRMICSSTDCA